MSTIELRVSKIPGKAVKMSDVPAGVTVREVLSKAGFEWSESMALSFNSTTVTLDDTLKQDGVLVMSAKVRAA